jgi:hypothetical protein
VHPYATDSDERRRLPLYMVGLAILLAWALNRGMEAADVSLPWWIDAPSVAGFYGLLYLAFDKLVWKLRLVRRVGLVKVPDLNGTWVGTVNPSGGEHPYEHQATMEIAQTWRHLCVRLSTANSGSRSVIGALITEEAGEAALTYEYINEPGAHAADNMHMHRGTARLRLTGGGVILEGEYYTGRDRKSHGTLRVSCQLLVKDRSRK